MVYIILILKVQSKVYVNVYTDAAVFNDGRFGRGHNFGFLQFSYCYSGYSHVKYCSYNIELCSFACPEHSHQIGLRCYGKSINNNNKIYCINLYLYNTLYTGNW